MRICFFSDVHGNNYALEAFFHDVEERNVDKMIFGGDFFGYYYDVDAVITKLRKKQVHCLLGNHDRMFLDIIEKKTDEQLLALKYGNTYIGIEERISEENRKFLFSLKSQYSLSVDNLRMAFVHGSIEDPLNGRVYPDTIIANSEKYAEWDYVFMGHTHHKMERLIEACILVNPGSIGQPRDGKGTSYVIFDTKMKQIEKYVFCYNTSDLLRDITVNENGNLEMIERLKELVTRER